MQKNTYRNVISGADQYLAVLYPLEYSAKITRGMSAKLIAGVWIVGILAATVASSQLISAGEKSPWISCRGLNFSLLGKNSNSLWLFCTSGVFFLVPVLILTGIYLRIFAAASKNSRDIRRNSFHNNSVLNLNPLEDVMEEEVEHDLPEQELNKSPKLTTEQKRNDKVTTVKENEDTFDKAEQVQGMLL